MSLDEKKPDGAKRRKRAAAEQSQQTPAATFEEALERLGAVVRDLEQGSLTLDESLTRYEQGIRCLKQCQRMLATAERKIEVLSGFDAAGNPITHALQDDEMTLEEKADSRSQRRSAGAKSTGRLAPKPHVGQPKPHVDPPKSDAGSREAGGETTDVDFPGTLF